jgi:hypothetical protein
MLRALLYGLAILHLGPGIAFAVLAFGCGPEQFLGDLCQKDTLKVFAGLTLVLWLLLSGGAVALRALRRRAEKAPATEGALQNSIDPT